MLIHLHILHALLQQIQFKYCKHWNETHGQQSFPNLCPLKTHQVLNKSCWLYWKGWCTFEIQCSGVFPAYQWFLAGASSGFARTSSNDIATQIPLYWFSILYNDRVGLSVIEWYVYKCARYTHYCKLSYILSIICINLHNWKMTTWYNR